MESDNSLPVKSVGGDTQPIKKDEGENEAINSQKTTESTEEITKDRAGKESPPLTDEPAVQEFDQNSKNMDEEQIKGHDEQINCETANVQSKKCQEQDNQETEEIKGNDEQGNQELPKENSNEPPSKVEDKSTASPPQQEMDDALQLVSHLHKKEHRLPSIDLRYCIYRMRYSVYSLVMCQCTIKFKGRRSYGFQF